MPLRQNGVRSKILLDSNYNHHRTTAVRTITFDDTSAELGIHSRLLKMDMEGEQYAPERADDTFKSIQHIEAEIHNEQW
ncbi:MAG: hypothetical protein QXU18_07165 [Thermoplasmatales archaeon]